MKLFTSSNIHLPVDLVVLFFLLILVSFLVNVMEETQNMESDLGKLFIGGISWETTEDRLKEYFMSYGEVVEAVIMKDRTTGRARGFGFVVFSDPAVAERVVLEKHMIDGRAVGRLNLTSDVVYM